MPFLFVHPQMANPPPEEDFVPPCARANQDQKMYLLTYMERHAKFSQGKYHSQMNDEDYQSTWRQLATSLNNFPGATEKSCSKWMKVRM